MPCESVVNIQQLQLNINIFIFKTSSNQAIQQLARKCERLPIFLLRIHYSDL